MLKAVIFNMDGVLTDSEPLHAEESVPDVCRLVRELKASGYLTAAVSSSTPGEMKATAASLRLPDCFDRLLSDAEVPCPRPAPDVFFKAAVELGVDPFETLIIEDTRAGVQAARAAGAACIGFVNPNSGKQDLSGASMLVEGFEEVDTLFLTQVWERFAGRPLTILETERLLIREFSADDFEALYRLNQIPEISASLLHPISGERLEREKLQAYIDTVYPFYGYGCFGVFLKDSDRLVGCCGLEPVTSDGTARIELGYCIDPDYQKLGYGFECVSGLLRISAERFGVDEVYARIAPNNTPSKKLAQKLGLKECEKDGEMQLYKINLA